jgi:hypothetical protein
MRAVPGPDDSQDLTFSGNVALDLGGSPEGEVASREALGDSAWARLSARRLAIARVLGSAVVRLRSRSGERTQLAADSAHVGFVNGRPDSVRLSGAASARYVSADGEAESRVTGEQVSVLLASGRVRRLTALGRAACRHTGAEGDGRTVELTGDRVSVWFEAGKLQRAAADGGVRGSYVPGRTESP